MRRSLALCFAVSALAFGQSEARADSYRDRSTAKKLEAEGIRLEQAGDCAGALDKLQQAAALVTQAPSTAIHTARCLEATNRWKEALAKYDQISHADVDPVKAKRDAEAMEQARQAKASLEKRMPSFQVKVDGLAEISEVSMTLDGEPFSRMRVGAKGAIDPGSHVVEGTIKQGGTTQTRRETFVAEDGKLAEVMLRFGAPPPPPTKADATPADSDPWARLHDNNSTQRTIGKVVIGLGAASLAAGIVANVAAVNTSQTLDAECPDRTCPRASFDTLNRYETLKALSIAGYITAGVATISGLALVVTAPEKHKVKIKEGLTVSPAIGPTSAYVVGKF